MSTRITQCFERLKQEKRSALITYTMAYDPDRLTSIEIIKSMISSGADIIEIGIPFSDPMADGPTIQLAGQRALAAGCTVKNTLRLVEDIRHTNHEIPIILMSYYNPIYQYSIQQFSSDARKSGVDGIIIVDLPPEEEQEFTDLSQPEGLDHIKLLAPTTNESRAKIVLQRASGFCYYISIAGITGTKSPTLESIKQKVSTFRNITKLPIVVGFGIKTADQVRELRNISDGIVIGSAIVKKIEENQKTAAEEISNLIKDLRAAL